MSLVNHNYEFLEPIIKPFSVSYVSSSQQVFLPPRRLSSGIPPRSSSPVSPEEILVIDMVAG